jgi:hypothetical protein
LSERTLFSRFIPQPSAPGEEEESIDCKIEESSLSSNRIGVGKEEEEGKEEGEESNVGAGGEGEIGFDFVFDFNVVDEGE